MEGGWVRVLTCLDVSDSVKAELCRQRSLILGWELILRKVKEKVPRMPLAGMLQQGIYYYT